jgi:hypothetical protein
MSSTIKDDLINCVEESRFQLLDLTNEIIKYKKSYEELQHLKQTMKFQNINLASTMSSIDDQFKTKDDYLSLPDNHDDNNKISTNSIFIGQKTEELALFKKKRKTK